MLLLPVGVAILNDTPVALNQSVTYSEWWGDALYAAASWAHDTLWPSNSQENTMADYWKRRAQNHEVGEFSADDIARMHRGLMPLNPLPSRTDILCEEKRSILLVVNDASTMPERELVNFARHAATGTLVTEADILYRLHPIGGAAGPWWTRTKPSSELQHRMDTAWRKEWGDADQISTLRIPPGHALKAWEGQAAYQGDYYFGAGNQIYVPRIPNGWITTEAWK
jgi:hypothetical protein